MARTISACALEVEGVRLSFRAIPVRVRFILADRLPVAAVQVHEP